MVRLAIGRRAAVAALALAALVLGLVATLTHAAAGAAPRAASRPVPTGFRATDVYYANPSDAWAIGDAKCAHTRKANCPVLIRTVDGGAHWTRLHRPAGVTSTHDYGSCGSDGAIHGPCVDRVLFTDQRHGYLWSIHSFYWTTNGGVTWKHEGARSPGAFELVRSGSHLLRLKPKRVCSSGCVGLLESAQIGSGRWTNVTPARSGLYSSRLAVRGRTAYFLSNYYAGGPGRGIFRTTDAGAHWQRIAAAPCGRTKTDSSDFSNLDEMFVARGGALAITCVTPHESVRIAPAGSHTFGPRHRLPGGYRLRGILDARHLVATHGFGTVKIARSGTGGAHWHRTATLRGYDDLTLLGNGFAYLLNARGTAVHVSTDAGTTWRDRTF